MFGYLCPEAIRSSHRATVERQLRSDNGLDEMPVRGCPWGAALSDLQRAGEPLRTKATEQFRRSAAGLHPDRRAAIATLAVSFSSLMLMRAVTDSRLREEIAESAQFAVESMIRNLDCTVEGERE